MAQEGDNCGKKYGDPLSLAAPVALLAALERNTEQPSPVQARPVS